MTVAEQIQKLNQNNLKLTGKMTDEQILELAEKHFSFITEYTATGWIADTEDLLKFSQAIRQDGYSEGYDDGYESAKVSTKMNTWSSDYD